MKLDEWGWNRMNEDELGWMRREMKFSKPGWVKPSGVLRIYYPGERIKENGGLGSTCQSDLVSEKVKPEPMWKIDLDNLFYFFATNTSDSFIRREINMLLKTFFLPFTVWNYYIF